MSIGACIFRELYLSLHWLTHGEDKWLLCVSTQEPSTRAEPSQSLATVGYLSSQAYHEAICFCLCSNEALLFPSTFAWCSCGNSDNIWKYEKTASRNPTVCLVPSALHSTRLHKIDEIYVHLRPGNICLLQVCTVNAMKKVKHYSRVILVWWEKERENCYWFIH